MPPRYAYWTILVDNQPTAFRAGAKEDLLPTFNRLKEKNPTAVMMWFQNGKLWPSRLDAQEAMLARGEMGRRGDARQGGFRERHKVGAPSGERRDRRERPEWQPRTQDSRPRTQDSRPKTQDSRPKSQAPSPKSPEKLEWKPKGEFTPAPKRSERSVRPDWKPKGSFNREHKPDWKSKTSRPPTFAKAPVGRQGPRTSRSEKLEWKPRTESGTRNPEPGTRAKRAWIPKEEYKKSKGIETPRDSKWRPGGEHRDPRQKYKDAKKAKWTKFKKTIRTRWESKKKKS